MSSSTSSSRLSPRARGLRVAFAIAAALFLVEWGARASVVPGTADLGRDFEERAAALAESPGVRIAVIGNSVADRIRPDVLAAEWEALTGEPASVDKFITYYSNLATWHRMSAQFFWKPGNRPDLVLVTYYEGNTLADSPNEDIGNLALYFTGPEDRRSLFANDLRTNGARSEYLLSSLSDAFATRDRIRDAMLHAIPGYRPYVTLTNAVEFRYEKRPEAAASDEPRTFHSLHAFLADARRAGVTVAFVASPSRPGDGHGPYTVSPRAQRMIADAGMLDIDMRRLRGLTADMYSDYVHLNGKGTPVYTRKLAIALHEAWKEP